MPDCVSVLTVKVVLFFPWFFVSYRQLLQEEEVDLTARGSGDLNTLQLAM